MTLVLNSDAIYALKNFVPDEDSLRTDYSGRGMFGRDCLGIVFDSMGALIDFVVDLTREVVEREAMGDDEHPLSEFVTYQLARVSTDNMGYDMIAYWPGVSVDSED